MTLTRSTTYQMPPLRILIAPSGFKESLGPDDVANCIETGIRRVITDPTTIVHKVPVHDGGEGFCHALVAAHGGQLRHLQVTGPTRLPIMSYYGVIGDDGKTAVLDMAAAAGLRLVPKECRDPTLTTSYGVGELIAAALDEGCTKIIVGCGDSGTSDCGAGMLQALGVQLLDDNDVELPIAKGGGTLTFLKKICTQNIHPRLCRSSESSPHGMHQLACFT